MWDFWAQFTQACRTFPSVLSVWLSLTFLLRRPGSTDLLTLVENCFTDLASLIEVQSVLF